MRRALLTRHSATPCKATLSRLQEDVQSSRRRQRKGGKGWRIVDCVCLGREQATSTITRDVEARLTFDPDKENLFGVLNLFTARDG